MINTVKEHQNIITVYEESKLIFIFIKPLFHVVAQPINNDMIVSGGQQRDSCGVLRKASLKIDL